MKEIEVEGLLARFMNGETSVEEETALADYFQRATDEDKPAGMPYEDWAAYREMFRQFDEGFEDMEYATKPAESGTLTWREKVHEMMVERHGRLWFGMSAAAVAALVVMVFTLDVGSGQVPPTIAEASDSVSSVTIPVDTIEEKSDKADIPPTPSHKAKPNKQRRLPYTLKVPRPLLAEADSLPSAVEAFGEDSMAVALEEAERLINAMTVYQEILINEICNVEFEEEY